MESVVDAAQVAGSAAVAAQARTWSWVGELPMTWPRNATQAPAVTVNAWVSGPMATSAPPTTLLELTNTAPLGATRALIRYSSPAVVRRKTRYTHRLFAVGKLSTRKRTVESLSRTEAASNADLSAPGATSNHPDDPSTPMDAVPAG